MKENLGQKEKTITKQYDFDINEEYEPHVIGKGYYEDYSLSLLPSFVGSDVSKVQNYCNSRGISLTINKVSTNSKSLNGEVMTQSLPAGMDAQYAGSMTVSVAEYGNTIIDDDDDTPTTKTDNTDDNNHHTNTDDDTDNTDNNDNTKIDDDEPDENIQDLISTTEETNSNISTN